MSRLSLVGVGVGLGVGLACAAGCTIETGYDPPPPPPWGVPLTGGTMIVTRDGSRAVVADPDRDRVVIVDLTTERIVDTILLAPGSEPGRAVDDGAGRIHVALRGSGELLTISGTDRVVRPVCGEPRGVVWQEATDLVHVACATGELVSVPAGGGEPTRVLHLERDLRDVVVRGDHLLVTTFRGAQVLELDAQGTVVGRLAPPITQRADVDGMVPAIPEVAWRTIALPDGTIMMSHQRRLGAMLRIVTGGYGGHCNGTPVESTLTSFGADNQPFAVAPITGATLPMDIAVNPANRDVAMVSAGNGSVFVLSSTTTTHPDSGGTCSTTVNSPLASSDNGAPTSVAFAPNGDLLVYYPEVDSIGVYGSGGGGAHGIALGDQPRSDPGRTLFHQETSSGLACASCHPEGHDDGGVWTFDQLGLRRTQDLTGGIVARAPYHWGADMPSFHTLVQSVFTQRMGGGAVELDQEHALLAWLDRRPAPRGVVVDPDAVTRGKDLFDEQGCASCHTGALMSSMRMENVTGTRVKVPSLIGVGARAPYMHDGCAPTLRDRFGACGGGDNHGHTSQLAEAQISDLIAYLESL